MKKIILHILRFLSKRIIKKYQPKIIGITGSVGKTSARDAIFAVLSVRFNVRKNIKNYNNEFGLPLTVIGMESPGGSAKGWFEVIKRGVSLLLKKQEYPEILILEMGVYYPGDIDYLINIAPVDVGVLTAVAEAHLKTAPETAKESAARKIMDTSGFGTIERIMKEKEKIVTKAKTNGRAVYNYDIEIVRGVESRLTNPSLSYGLGEGADVRARDISFVGLEEEFCSTQSEWECKEWGTSFKVAFDGSSVPVFLPHVIGKQQVYAALAAISVGLSLDMNLIEISTALQKYRPEPGRMNVIAGNKGTLIIDDTYNSSPIAARAAIDMAQSIQLKGGARRFAVLGSMLELGESSEKLHREIGTYVVDHVFDFLFCVGSETLAMCEAAKEAGLDPIHVKHFDSSLDAGEVLEDFIQSNDLILVKGSQGARMEKVVKQVMADPLRAEELLVRQTGEWKGK